MQANIASTDVYKLFRAAVNAIWGAEPRDLSLLYALWYARRGGQRAHPGQLRAPHQHRRRVRRRAASSAARSCCRSAWRPSSASAVVVGSPVRAITQDRHGVTVESDRVTVRARRAIVAILPALTAAITFSPPLPGLRAQLIQRMPHGTLAKAEAIYDRPFWRDAGLSGQAVSDVGPGADDVRQLAAGRRGPACCSASSAATTHAQWMQRSPSARRAAVLENFVTYFGERARHPRSYIEDNSAADEPWIRGCPTVMLPPGVLSDFGPAIREPRRPGALGGQRDLDVLGRLHGRRGALRRAGRRGDPRRLSSHVGTCRRACQGCRLWTRADHIAVAMRHLRAAERAPAGGSAPQAHTPRWQFRTGLRRPRKSHGGIESGL